MNNLHWVGIGLHVAVALVATALLMFIGVSPWFVAGVNALAWFIRELIQRKGASRPLSPLTWSLNKHVEWVAPTIVGAIMAVMWPSIFMFIYN